MMPWASRLKTPLIITGAASSQIPERVHDNYKRYKYVFHGYLNSAVIALATCLTSEKMFIKNKKLSYLNRAVIFSEDADWTKPVDKMYKKCLPKAGFKVVDTIVFSPKTSDFRPLYSRVEKDKANIIMAAVAHVGVKPVVQWHQQQVPALFAGINGQGGSSAFWKATNGATEGMITGNVGANGVPLTPKTSGFYKAYTKQFGVTEPAYDAYTTYDTIYALKHAIEKARSTKANDLVNALEKVNFTGVSGQIHYHGKKDKYTHEVVFSANPKKGMSYVVIQWQKGKQVVVWPKKLAEGEIEIPSFVPQPSK
jgi:branched-chain amino acid transport system substrate-binding protein